LIHTLAKIMPTEKTIPKRDIILEEFIPSSKESVAWPTRVESQVNPPLQSEG
jgi:hypothetical protein